MQLTDALTTICIALTSLTAGSIFCFPLFGPTLTRDLGLNLTQTNTLWGGAVLGEYLSAAIWGALGDAYGPRWLSGSAAVIFAVGYQLMSHADIVALNLDHPFDEERKMAKGSFVVTLAAFTAIGSGVAASYFAAVTASTRLYRSKPGLAIAGPLTLFSLSSLFLTSLGTRFFSDPETGDLQAANFLSFLGWLLGATNVFSTIFMKPPPPEPAKDDHSRARRSSHSRALEPDERTSLLSADNADNVESAPEDEPQAPALPGVPESQSLFAFLSTPSVWALGLLMVVGVGASEMVMGSVGNMVVALLPAPTPSAWLSAAMTKPVVSPIALQIRANQVKLLAAANTVSRLLGGLLSDALAPSGINSQRSYPTVSRITLLLGAVLLSSGAYAWAAFGLRTTDGLPLFSLSVGIGYGLVFTLVPAITVASFGNRHFGRNWGMLSYCCALGSLTYSLLYALVSDAVASKHDEHQGGKGALCTAGPECFRASFIVALVGMGLAGVALVPVWKRWRHHL